MPDFVSKLLENNRNWVKNKLQTDPDFFNNLSSRHEPQLLWIGCSDARVPANREMFLYIVIFPIWLYILI